MSETQSVLFQRLALLLFCIYLAIFPGSTITVALNRVPDWGEWMGGALLMLQGAAVLCWLVGSYGRHGALAALVVLLLAWGVEQLGVTTGFPFGRYHYTGALQPQLFGVVPLPIASAWLTVAIGAWQLATNDQRPATNGSSDWRLGIGNRGRMTPNRQSLLPNRSSLVGSRSSVVGTATLVLLLDAQIETIATHVNRYWVWVDSGPYYGVPTANFVAWWLVGLGMAFAVDRLLCRAKSGPSRKDEREKTGDAGTAAVPRASSFGGRVGIAGYILRSLPALLYLLSTLMFAVVNLARGYTLAGLIGAAVLLALAMATIPPAIVKLIPPSAEGRRRSD
jgi:putative membrane protein